jgi:hypothetical protein
VPFPHHARPPPHAAASPARPLAPAPAAPAGPQSGDYVFDILVWNERMLQFDQQDGNPEEQLSGYTKLKDRFKGLLSGW